VTPDWLVRRFYPDERWDGTKAFYDWVRSAVAPSFVVLNVGAGKTADRRIRSLRGEVARVVGADIDPAVRSNDDLDEAVVLEGDRFPFGEGAFDLAWADYVLEHVEHPGPFLSEVRRVLKRGASFYFRTPNKRHYVAAAARLTPHWFHDLVANRVRGLAKEAGHPYPTYYRLNTVDAIERSAVAAGFGSTEYRLVECEPSYLMFHPLPFLVGVSYERLVNRVGWLAGLRANIFGRLTR